MVITEEIVSGSGDGSAGGGSSSCDGDNTAGHNLHRGTRGREQRA